MNLYYELLGHPVFTVEDVAQYYDNVNSVRSALRRLVDQGLVVRVRNNLYTCISGESGSPVANRYQVACAVTNTACISHHTAIEYYGLSDQIYYEVYVSSETKFREFEFDGYVYRYIPVRFRNGIENVGYSGGVRVTDLERTLLDSISDMDHISGIEEIISFIRAIQRLDEKRLRQYLIAYGRQFLFQKTGYLLEMYGSMEIDDGFYDFCREHIGKSKRYLSKDIRHGTYNSKWKLVVPDTIELSKNGGMEAFAAKQYMPELLFDDEDVIERVRKHPMALWKCRR